jgi:hypothetical protein
MYYHPERLPTPTCIRVSAANRFPHKTVEERHLSHPPPARAREILLDLRSKRLNIVAMQTEIFDGVCGGLSYRYTISFKVSSFDPKKKVLPC